jgi:hypothetical protein
MFSSVRCAVAANEARNDVSMFGNHFFNANLLFNLANK